ncbi:hypothetical protein [Halorhabdus sp. SVX81]|uniref:hypothetical protein n=1 Tax=Halorhabdus sp. SVX81 TaxID=2978283 RepID=UPI0023DAE3EA|nr:hypothetical protein [Halorhabdus sp. SVX81]
MIDQMQDPADSILAEEDYGHLPVTRHHLRRKGLQAIDEMENRMIEGETIISGLIAIIGVLLSLFALYPNTVRTLSSGYVRPAEEPVTMVSVLATLAGLFVVILIVTRYTIISNMMFSDKELSQGKPRILFIKQAWNSFVAKQPIMALTGFYLLHFADIAGEEVYNELLDMMGDAMQPNLNKVEFMRTNSHRIIGAMSREFRSE